MLATLDLPPDPASVRTARRWAADRLREQGLDDQLDTVALLVSELVSNAVLHAGTACTIELAIDPTVRVAVRDGSDDVPTPAELVDPLAPSGRGLLLVGALAAAHGVDRLPEGGKRVWFELAPAAAGPPAAVAPPHATTA